MQTLHINEIKILHKIGIMWCNNVKCQVGNCPIFLMQKEPSTSAFRMFHYSEVIMSAMITSLTTVYSTVYSGADQRKYQNSASLGVVRGIHRWPVNSPHKGPVMRKMFPFDDVIMWQNPGSDMVWFDGSFISVSRIPTYTCCTVYPKKYAHGFCFPVLCCGYTLTDFPISIRLTSLVLWQSNDCPSASKATLMNMDKYFMWIHYEQLHNHKKAKHNKTVCIFLGIYCMFNTLRQTRTRWPTFSTRHYETDFPESKFMIFN